MCFHELKVRFKSSNTLMVGVIRISVNYFSDQLYCSYFFVTLCNVCRSCLYCLFWLASYIRLVLVLATSVLNLAIKLLKEGFYSLSA